MANIKSIDQTTLIENCVQNKDWAQKQLYDMYQSSLFPICLRYAIDTNEAKDMFQEGFIRIFNNLKQYRNDGSFEGWLKRVMVTTALNYLKKHRKQIHSDVDQLHQPQYAHNNIQTKIDTNDIMMAFNQLPYNYRIVLNMHIIEGYGYKELSEILEIEESSCRTRVFRGKQLLQKILTENKIVTNLT